MLTTNSRYIGDKKYRFSKNEKNSKSSPVLETKQQVLTTKERQIDETRHSELKDDMEQP